MSAARETLEIYRGHRIIRFIPNIDATVMKAIVEIYGVDLIGQFEIINHSEVTDIEMMKNIARSLIDAKIELSARR